MVYADYGIYRNAEFDLYGTFFECANRLKIFNLFKVDDYEIYKDYSAEIERHRK
jgi:hypothetical protein